MIKVFCSRKEKDLVNFWNHMVFHPTNAIEDDWGKRQLETLASAHAVQIVRIYAMFEESVTLGENGALRYDFSLNDQRIDTLLENRLTPYIVFAFFPPFLAAEPDEGLLARRYKGKVISRSYPSDYAVWEEICRVYTAHLVERYGEDTVAGWHMHCYNEPELKYFFYWNAPDWKTRAVEYCKLYEAFVRGVNAVSRRLLIGGPGLAGSPYRWSFLQYFLEFVKEKHLQLDFISHHCGYGTSPAGMITGEDPLNVKAAVGDIPVIGNGDIVSAHDAFYMVEYTGCDSVAVGRAALGDPWIFRAIRDAREGKTFIPPTRGERIATALRLIREVIEEKGEYVGVREARGRVAHFIRGMRGAPEVRDRINHAETYKEIEKILLEGLGKESER